MHPSAVCLASIAGIVPRCLEAMDQDTVQSVQVGRPLGYPDDPAVLLIELDGKKHPVANDSEAVEKLCRRHGAANVLAMIELKLKRRPRPPKGEAG